MLSLQSSNVKEVTQDIDLQGDTTQVLCLNRIYRMSADHTLVEHGEYILGCRFTGAAAKVLCLNSGPPHES